MDILKPLLAHLPHPFNNLPFFASPEATPPPTTRPHIQTWTKYLYAETLFFLRPFLATAAIIMLAWLGMAAFFVVRERTGGSAVRRSGSGSGNGGGSAARNAVRSASAARSVTGEGKGEGKGRNDGVIGKGALGVNEVSTGAKKEV